MMKTKIFSLALAAISTVGSFTFAADKDIVDTAVAAGKFTKLAAALGAADLVGALKGPGPFTVFAPSDEAFAKLPAGTVETLLKPENKAKLASILTFHVVKGKVMAAETLNGQRVDVKVDGSTVSIDSSKVVTADIACSNGVIHVIDTVLMPVTENIPAVADKAGKFKTLLKAVKEAGLVETLSGTGPFTVFAPTDEAFDKLPKGTVADLLKPENKATLAGILTYHVIPGRVYSEAAVAAKSAKTVQGATVAIKANDKGAFVNESKIIATDVDASNGVIHIIDTVLMPPAK